MTTLVATGDVNRAVATAGTIEDSRRRHVALRRIAEAWGKTADLAAIEMMGEPFVRALALAGVAIQRAGADDVEEARRAIAAALTASGTINDPDMHGGALLAIGEACGAIGEVEGARAILDAIASSTAEIGGAGWRRLSAMRSVATAQAKSGDYVAALATVDEIDNFLEPRGSVLDIAAALPN